jgi:hypothetical protein
MAILLSISAADLDDESLQKLTLQLCRDLREDGIESSVVEQPAIPGTRGDLVTIGQILVAAIGAGGPIVTLVNALKAYVQRKPSLRFEFQTKDGNKLKITADDLRNDDMEKLLQRINPMIEGTK